MRKNIKNNMITRIMAIGLATVVIATSVPATVFADDEETVSVESSESSSDSSSESSSDDSSESSADTCESVSCESEAPAVEAAPEIAEAALEEGTVVAEILIIDNNTVPEVAEAAPEAVAEDAEVAETGEKSLVEIASESIDNLENKTETVNQDAKKSSDEADSAVENAEIANTSNSKTEAYQANDDAIDDVTAAEEDLVNATEAYDEAVKAKEQAEADVAAAEAEYDAAVERLKEMKETASKNLTAANEQLKAAQKSVTDKRNELAALREKEAALKKVEVQYYAVMDYYFSTVLGTAKYDENNKLDIAKSMENLTQKKIDEKALSPGGDMFKYGRGLMEDLIEYMLVNDGNSNVSIAHYDPKEGDTMPGDKEKVPGTNGKKIYKHAKDASGNTTVEIWEDLSNYRNGRCNHIEVTYTDRSGKTQTAYFNYVFKNNGTYGEKTDIENGPVYLALIEKGEDGKWMEKRAESANNLDNYGDLTNRIANIESSISRGEAKLRQAKADCNKAAEKVEEYKEELRQLENTKIDDSKVKELKKRLAEAVEDLSEAEATKEALEVKVEEARKIVDAIDLSRFDVSDVADRVVPEPSEDSEPVVPVYPVPTVSDIDIPEIIPSIPTVLPTVIASFPTSGVLGVRAVADAGLDNVVSDVAKKPAAVKEIKLGGDVLGTKTANKVVKIDNNLVPLAAAPMGEENGFNWWWIVALVGTAVVIFIVVYKKREEDSKAKAVNK